MRIVLLIAVLMFAPLPVTATTGDEAPTLLGLICHAGGPPTIAGPHRLVMLPGMGDDHMAADTKNPAAQRWFDYGLTLARSFEHSDAILAFQQAEAADPTCSLCAWGEAWARGQTINYGVSRGQTAAALVLARKARELATPDVLASIRSLESALIDRYAAANSAAGNRAFAADLDAMDRADPTNVEIAIFDAEAWLIVQDGGATSTAMRAVDVLRPLVPTHLDSSGLIHFYIHATEDAGVPELAAPYAERVAQLAPNASHMVHMPSHTDFRIGRYEAAALANVAALRVDRAYAERTDFPTPLGRLMYHFHDIQFGLGAAMMSGDAKIALQLVQQFNHDFPSPSTYDPRAEMAGGQTYAALGRFAAPQAVLAAPDTVSAKPFLEAMRHYARGEAFVRLSQPAAVRAEAAVISLPGDDPAAPPRSTAAVVARIARLTLEGNADMLNDDPAASARVFLAAADLQDARLAEKIDPPRWWYPVRRSLAAALLASGDALDAERQASTVLKTWRLDPLTLAIRARAEQRLGSPGAAADLTAARHGWHGDPRSLRADQLS